MAKEPAKIVLRVEVELPDLNSLEEVKSALDDLQALGLVRVAEITIPHETKMDVRP